MWVLMMSPIHSLPPRPKGRCGSVHRACAGEGRDKRDTIIVSNRRDKASQTFFRRDGSKGDVVSFIRENLSSFNVIGLPNGEDSESDGAVRQYAGAGL